MTRFGIWAVVAGFAVGCGGAKTDWFGTATEGMACSSTADCMAGLECRVETSGGVCRAPAEGDGPMDDGDASAADQTPDQRGDHDGQAGAGDDAEDDPGDGAAGARGDDGAAATDGDADRDGRDGAAGARGDDGDDLGSAGQGSDSGHDGSGDGHDGGGDGHDGSH